jgi:glycosyltransferase involved in cell wall biosynthesis
MKPKMLIISGYYFPAQNYGGPGVSIYNLTELLHNDIEFYIVAKNHDYGSYEIFKDIKPGWNDVANAHVLYLSDNDYNYSNIRDIVENLSVDIIYKSGVYLRSVKNAVWLSRVTNKPLIIAPHGELNDGALNIKAVKKRFYLALAKVLDVYSGVTFHATCDDEVEGILRYIGAGKDRILYIPHVPCAMRKTERPFADRKELRIIFIGRVCRIKNIQYSISVVGRMNIPVKFDIYGNIEDEAYYSECMREVQKCGKSITINFLGSADHEQCIKALGYYDVFLSMTQSENYGRSIVEALSVGCPVIISKNRTPWDDLDKRAGFVVEINDADALIDKLMQLYHMTPEEYAELVRHVYGYFQDKFKTEELRIKYLESLKRVIRR